MKALISTLSKFSGLPAPAKAVLAVLGGGSLLTFAYFLFNGNTFALLIIVIGIIAVILLLLLYKAILNWFRKRRANPLTQGIAGNAAAAPQGISEPARRARLDDLRRNFEQGVEKFRAAGKNLYSVPWYVLVGEPGSGKTEAIRHCNVGFPPGLQDQLQGAGGTLNMNWWFTNQAIILDTAGRLMFEEVVPGSTNEWNEFLKLLKNNRPSCPINGMLLVIPVDTLIKDTADSIEKKATKIAQQFDQIQRILGVRFPVFIIVTKCDLLNGFREFFDDLNDPQLQHQIMGWSNPAPLDEKFNPSAVTNHLETVKQRLVSRRQQLLLDPINTEDPQGRRIDQVDALYALPDSIVKIGPRLRRYLEMIFVAGEWSPKPLFLRGIYFTSSMTEGSALDAELAEVLGVPVDSLPEGRVWRRDRAYFLRDLFIEKVFREKGLVTHADNADKQLRGRRAIIMTCGFLAVIVLFVLAWLGSSSLESRIGKHRDFWVAAADTIDPQYTRIVEDKKNAYYTDTFKVGKAETTIAGFFGDNLDLVKSDIRIPVIFRPMTILGGNVNTGRRISYRSLYEATILRPIYLAARRKIPTLTPATWNDDANYSLVQLMKLEYAYSSHNLPKDDPHPQVEIDPMFRLVLSPADYDLFKSRDQARLQEAADWIYTSQADGAKAWPAAYLQPGTSESLSVVQTGLDTALTYWAAQVTDKSPRIGNLQLVRLALDDFRAAERKLLLLKNRSVLKPEPYSLFVDDWQAAMVQLTDARNRALTNWNIASKGAPDSATFKSMYTDALDRIAGDAQKAYSTFLKLTPESADARATDAAKALYAAHQKIQVALDKLKDWRNGPTATSVIADVSALDEAYMSVIKIDGTPRHRFEIQGQLYELADGLLPRPNAAPSTQLATASTGDALAKVDSDISSAGDMIVKLTAQAQGQDLLSQAGDLARNTVDVGARYRRYVIVTSAINTMPVDAEKWPDYIASRAGSFPPDHLVRPQVPLVTAEKTFLARYSPDAAGAAAIAMTAIEKLCKDPANKILDADNIAANSSKAKRALDGYLVAYRRYWQKDAFEELRFASKNWAEVTASLVGVKEQTIRASLEEYARKAQEALNSINATADSAAIEAEIQAGRGGAFKEECAEVLGNWKDIGDDYRQVRRAILAMDPNRFFERYVVTSAKHIDSFAGRFWTAMPLAALRVVANDSKEDIISGLQELTKYQRFPLALPGDPKDDLTSPQLLAARVAIEKIKGASTATLAGGARSVGQGGLTKDKDVDATLESLRGAYLLKEQQQYLDRLEKFFVALPSDAKPVAVGLSVIKEKLKESNAVSQKYAYLLISQGGKELREAYLQGPDPDRADVEYPGGDLLLQFRDVPNGPIIQTDTFPGLWAPFRLIRSPNVKVVSRDGAKWTLEYTVTDPNKKTWSLWLLLEFKADLPDLREWPVPPAK